jgi:hypothetical protein
LWNSCCEKSNKPYLRWTDADKTRLLPGLSDVVEAMETSKLSDEGLEQRLSILCNRLDEAGGHLSNAFKNRNKNGLTAQSFAMYGRDLMAEADKMLTAVDDWALTKKASDVFK